MMKQAAMQLISLLIGATWVLAGTTKFYEIIASSSASLNNELSWVSTFPTWVMAIVALCEIVAGLLLLAGVRRTGLLLGLGMLASFSVAAVAFPPEPDQSCGCLGSLAVFDAHSVLARIMFLVGVHCVAYMLTTARPMQDQSNDPSLANEKVECN